MGACRGLLGGPPACCMLSSSRLHQRSLHVPLIRLGLGAPNWHRRPPRKHSVRPPASAAASSSRLGGANALPEQPTDGVEPNADAGQRPAGRRQRAVAAGRARRRIRGAGGGFEGRALARPANASSSGLPEVQSNHVRATPHSPAPAPATPRLRRCVGRPACAGEAPHGRPASNGACLYTGRQEVRRASRNGSCRERKRERGGMEWPEAAAATCDARLGRRQQGGSVEWKAQQCAVHGGQNRHTAVLWRGHRKGAV